MNTLLEKMGAVPPPGHAPVVKTRVYISGPMTGLHNHNVEAFERAKEALEAGGDEVVSPVDISRSFGSLEEIEASFEALYCRPSTLPPRSPELAKRLMEADLAAVRSCEVIYMLRGWQDSTGAKKELAEAITHGLRVELEPRKL